MERVSSGRTGLRDQHTMYHVFVTGLIFSAIFWPLLNSIISIIMAAWWLVFGQKTWSRKRLLWIGIFILPYLVTVLSGLYSANKSAALDTIQVRSAMLLYPFVFGTTTVIDKRFLQRQLFLFAGLICLGILICLGHALYLFMQDRSREHFYGYNLVWLKGMTAYTFSLTILLCNLAVVYLVRQPADPEFPVSRHRYLYALMLLFCFGFQLLLGNRSTLVLSLGLLVYTIFIWLPSLRVKMAVLAFLVIAVGISVWANPFLARQVRELVDISNHKTIKLDQDSSLGMEWGGSQLRLAIWQCAAGLVERHPVTGVGVGDTQDSLQQEYENRKFYFASRYNMYNAHNQYMQEAVSTGITGSVIWLAALFLPLTVAVSWKRKEMMVLFCVLMMASCLTDTPLDANKSLVLYAFFNSLLFFELFTKEALRDSATDSGVPPKYSA